MNRYLLMLVLLMIGAPSAKAADASADLTIRSARLEIARPMNTFGYNAVIANEGPDAASNVEVLVLLPPGVAIRNPDACRQQSSGLARCALGTLAAGEERRVFLLLTSPARHPQVTAVALSDTPDPNASNNFRGLIARD